MILLVTEKFQYINLIAVILSLACAFGGNGPFSGLQDVTVNSSPKAGALPPKRHDRTLRAHPLSLCELTALLLWLIFLNTTVCVL